MSHFNKKPVHNIVTDTATQPDKDDKTLPMQAGAGRKPLLNRRRFIQSMSIGVVGSAGLMGCKDDKTTHLANADPSATFEQGVASGDPLADKVIIWTRVTPTVAKPIKVNWVMATDKELTQIVKQGQVVTSAKQDYTVKVDVDGLTPATEYYYCFTIAQDESASFIKGQLTKNTNPNNTSVKSRVGRTKTLPVDNVEQVKLAVFSCSNYPAGYFHAYADAAARDDLDVAVHLGDYIYEYGRTDVNELGQVVPAYASSEAKALNREVNPENELIDIQDYRTRYAQYRTDADLQALHASLPMIAVWDDHELSNDAYQQGAQNHQPDTEGQWDDRKLAAVTAYHEWMPTRNQVASEIYRRFDFGSLLSLHMLDTRVVGRDKQLDYQQFIEVDTPQAALV